METKKTLKSARPLKDAETGNVVRWRCEVEFSHDDFARTYSYDIRLDAPDRKPEEFTRAELLAAMPAALDEVFEAHCTHCNEPPKFATDPAFSIDMLPEA